MATIGNTVPTLLDVAKRLNPDGGGIMPIAELLSQENEMLLDMPWYEGNLPTGSRITTRTGLPDVIYRKLNSGVPPSKSTTAQVDEACGILEARGQVDVDLAMLNGNTAGFRLSESRAFMEAMNQAMQRGVMYGNTDVTPSRSLVSRRASTPSAPQLPQPLQTSSTPAAPALPTPRSG